ncbi:MAG: Rrf2 family transcriptional regulator [Oscillospiraceae bacterium]|jgi:Rrf2 family protein|nr:Rrf2 family transcriptional regulator [Oscillospiraceae bacterium]
MKISTRGRYALRAMIDLAEHHTGTYIPLRDVAGRQDISEKYLESILPALTKAGYVDGLRGKGGGYKLSRPAESYTVGSILRLAEGSLAPVACLDCSPNQCPRAAQCRTLPMWQRLNDTLNAFFDGITLADLCREVESGGDFVI